MGLLDSTGGGGALSGGLGGKLLPRGLASSGLACGLLSSCHSFMSVMCDEAVVSANGGWERVRNEIGGKETRAVTPIAINKTGNRDS